MVNSKEAEIYQEEQSSLAVWQEVKGGEIFEFKKENDSLEGELVDIRSEVGENKSFMYDIFSGQKLWSIWGNTVLDGKMKRLKTGDQIKIVFVGWKKSEKRKGREYKDFKVFSKPKEL